MLVCPAGFSPSGIQMPSNGMMSRTHFWTSSTLRAIHQELVYQTSNHVSVINHTVVIVVFELVVSQRPILAHDLATCWAVVRGCSNSATARCWTADAIDRHLSPVTLIAMGFVPSPPHLIRQRISNTWSPLHKSSSWNLRSRHLSKDFPQNRRNHACGGWSEGGSCGTLWEVTMGSPFEVQHHDSHRRDP